MTLLCEELFSPVNGSILMIELLALISLATEPLQPLFQKQVKNQIISIADSFVS